MRYPLRSRAPLPHPFSSELVFVRGRECDTTNCIQPITNVDSQAIGAAQDAARMERVVNFYAGLPRGPAAPVKASGLIGRYQARYFSGKNASGARTFSPTAAEECLMYTNDRSPCSRHCRYLDPGLQHGVLLPPAYVMPSQHLSLISHSCAIR